MSKYVIKKRKIKSTKSRDEKVRVHVPSDFVTESYSKVKFDVRFSSNSRCHLEVKMQKVKVMKPHKAWTKNADN